MSARGLHDHFVSTGAYGDTIVGVVSPVAKQAAMVTGAGGPVTRMEIPGATTVKFTREGDHVVLGALQKPVERGETFIVTLLFAAGIGFINGYVVVKTKLPSFIVTLATFFVLRGTSVGGVLLHNNHSTQVSVTTTHPSGLSSARRAASASSQGAALDSDPDQFWTASHAGRSIQHES